MTTYKRYIINLFIDIKQKLFTMLDADFLHPSYSKFLSELAEILSKTLSKIETIYYKYFLLPKLQHIYKSGAVVPTETTLESVSA